MNVPILSSFHVDTAQYEFVPDGDGEYVMKVTIGTPPFDLYAIADAGSDLVWAQCLPCDLCFPQKMPKCNPKSSSTYRDISCQSQKCNLRDYTWCHPPANTCNYTYGYADLSLTSGVLATETLTFASTVGPPLMLPDVVFGCGHYNIGNFSENDMRIVGLGKGPASLVLQMGSPFGGRRFSQCPVPFHAPPTITSKMIFGNGSEVSGPSTVTTTLVAVKDDPGTYYVTLSGISIGSSYVPFNSSSAGAIMKGNMTTLMLVPTDFYNRLEVKVRRAAELPPIDDPELRPQLCYGRDVLAKGPVLTAHFDGKAGVELKPTSTFIEAKDGIFCFAMSPIYGPWRVFGNIAQTDYLIAFDLDRETLSFKPTNCTKL